MNQKRIGLSAPWMSFIYLGGLVMLLLAYAQNDVRFDFFDKFLIFAFTFSIVYVIMKCWVVANAFQFNLRPERESELPEGAWNVTAAFPDPLSRPAGHFFLVLNTLTPDKQRDVYATLVVQRQMLDLESANRISGGERPMTIVIKDGIVGFKWQQSLDHTT